MKRKSADSKSLSSSFPLVYMWCVRFTCVLIAYLFTTNLKISEVNFPPTNKFLTRLQKKNISFFFSSQNLYKNAFVHTQQKIGTRTFERIYSCECEKGIARRKSVSFFPAHFSSRCCSKGTSRACGSESISLVKRKDAKF